VQGKVLPGYELRNQVVVGQPSTFVDANPMGPRYPGGTLPVSPAQPTWRGLEGIAPSRILPAASASAVFNREDAAYRIAFHLSHYGGAPDSAGDFNGDGVEDLLVTDHFSYVDGMRYAGEVHLYFGRRGRHIDPRTTVPDIIFYGDEADAKLGIGVAPAGDVNGDGYDDLLMSAAFHSAGAVPEAGHAYLVYGGFLNRFRCPVKVRAEEIGRRVPGLLLEGGSDGGRLIAWFNGLDSGDFNGDGFSDVVVGAYDPYPGAAPTFPARAYVIYGGPHLPDRFRGYRLGLDRDVAGVRSSVYTLPDGELTRSSGGFGTFFAGDLNGDRRDELAFSVGGPGADRGSYYFFFGTPSPPIGADVPIETAALKVTADELALPALRFRGLQSVRPAGDVNGDGLADALLTARHTSARIGGEHVRVGAAGILFGAGSYPPELGFSDLGTILHGSQPGLIGQPAHDRGSDLSGDGRADILLNDPLYVESIGGQLQNRGRLWQINGAASMPKTIDVQASASRHIVADTTIPGMLGFTWTTGDWDADGRADMVIGDHYAGDSQLHDHAGVAYLFYGGPPAAKTRCKHVGRKGERRRKGKRRRCRTNASLLAPGTPGRFNRER
jgi:hypothetical protein